MQRNGAKGPVCAVGRAGEAPSVVRPRSIGEVRGIAEGIGIGLMCFVPARGQRKKKPARF